MADLVTAFAFCLYLQQIDPAFLPTECHQIDVRFLGGPLALDLQTKDRPEVRAYIEEVARSLK